MPALPPDQIARARAVDLLALLGPQAGLRRVSGSHGGEYAGPCPACGGRDRFVVQPGRGRWLCRHCAPRWDDAIALQRTLTGQSFPEAVAALAGGDWPVVCARGPDPPGPPPAAWQAQARGLAERAGAALFAAAGRQALKWLRARGLRPDTLRRWQIGWVSRALVEPAARWGLARDQLVVPSGVLIPDPANGWLKVRRFGVRRGKYRLVRGSAPGLYLSETLPGATAACLVEGELDALLLWQCLRAAPDLTHVAVVTPGSQSPHPRPEWLTALARRRVLLMFHQDAAGEAGARRWLEARPGTVRVRWPLDKDLTDFHLTGGDLAELVRAHAGLSDNPAPGP